MRGHASLWLVPDADLYRYHACVTAANALEREAMALRAQPTNSPRDLITDVTTDG